jgi:hypothetical protein
MFHAKAPASTESALKLRCTRRHVVIAFAGWHLELRRQACSRKTDASRFDEAMLMTNAEVKRLSHGRWRTLYIFAF